MNLNKKIAKTMVFALGLGAVSFLGNYGARVEAAPSFDNKTGFLTAENNTGFWAVAKPVKDAKKANVKDNNVNYVIKPADIEAYSAGINLTALGEGKELYIAYGENTTVGADGVYTGWKVQKIGAASKKFNVYYLGEQAGKMGKITATKAKGGDAGYLGAVVSDGKKDTELDLAAADSEKVFVKAGDADWVTFKKFFGGDAAPDDGKVNTRLKSLVQRGASLTFKYAADDTSWTKEAKVKITAQPKAPKVGVDVQKEEVTSLKKGMQYQVVEKTGDTEPALTATWQDVPENTKSISFATVKAAAIENAKNYTLFVRNKADKKKVASKIAKIKLKGTTALEAIAAIENKPEGKLHKDDNKVTIALVRQFDLTKGATITNKTTDDYEIYVDGKENAKLPDKAKWTLLKGKKNAEAKDVVLKLKYDKATGKANSYSEAKFNVLIRKAGKKLQNGEATLASAVQKAVVTLGKVEQAGSLVQIPGDATVAGANVTATYTPGEDKEINFTYKITNYQKFDKKPKLEVTKVDNVTVKVGNFEEVAADATVTVTLKLGKKATGNVVQKIKLSAEGVTPAEYTITFNPAS